MECNCLLGVLPQLRESVKKLWSSSLTAKLEGGQQAWVHRDRSVLIFDFDDTLFPTNVMERQFDLDENSSLRAQLTRIYKSEVKVSTMERQYSNFLKAVKELLQEAYSFGSVIIVTLGERKRMQNILENIWPEFAQVLDRCTFVYAREHMSKTKLQMAEKLGSTASSGDKAAKDWAELWTSAKKDAILKFLREHDSNGKSKEVGLLNDINEDEELPVRQLSCHDWLNVLSVGDSVFERDATILACSEYTKEREDNGYEGIVRIKTLKCLENPNLATLALQLESLRLWMPSVVCQDCDSKSEFDVKLQLNEDLGSGEKAPFLGVREPPKYCPGMGWSIDKQEALNMLPWSKADGEEQPIVGA